MPRIDKTVFTSYVTTGCEKQLRINLHPLTRKHLPEREAINLPMPQIRPALQELRKAGDRWGWQKVHELNVAFGAKRLHGDRPKVVGSGATQGLSFEESRLREHINKVKAGDFIVEAHYAVGTRTFRDVHGLTEVDVEGRRMPMDFQSARPDIIEVLHQDPARKMVTARGALKTQADDGRLALRVIDVKLNSEPGPKYFAELAFYSLALAAYLVDKGLDDRFVVSADAAIWPGSEEASGLLAAGTSAAEKYAALHATLVLAPMRVFITDAMRVLHTLIPGVLSTPYEDLPWAVTPKCQGCENLGQRWMGEDSEEGDRASDYRAGHCIPTAKQVDHLSRFPFLSRGSMDVLRSHKIDDVTDAASISVDHPAFGEHHRLRAQRNVIADRAAALTGEDVDPIDAAIASTAALPAFSRLRLYITADFDSASAISLAFGFSWAWLGNPQPQNTVSKERVHQVDAGTADAEWVALSGLLSDIHQMLVAGRALEPNASVQVYVWDTLTLDHLARVVSRHLARILADGLFPHLAWLFPPQELIGNHKLAKTPAVSVLRDAVRTLMALPLAHNYNLLDTARLYQDPESELPRSFNVPPFWSDPFSDQIPPERAHQMWTRASTKKYTHNDVIRDLGRTVKVKLRALASVTDQLSTDLRGRLPRQAPNIVDIRAPRDPGTISVLGSFLLAHARLDYALQELKVTRTNALPLDEREARFESAILEHEITGRDAAAVLRESRLQARPDIHVYRLAAGSVDVKAKVSEFTWSVLPESMTYDSTKSYDRFMNGIGRSDLAAAPAAKYSRYATLASIFGVKILHLDRGAKTIVVEFDDYPRIARGYVLDTGEIDMSGVLVLNQTSRDFLSDHVDKTWKAIKTPPSAVSDPRINAAIGMTRKPRVSDPHPAEHFIWDPAALVAQTISRPVADLKELAIERGHKLNSSQFAAWEAALTRRLTLIWGPPGTGKTATLLAVLESLAADSSRQRLRVGITAPTWAALDNLIEPLHARYAGVAPSMQFRRMAGGPSTPSWLNTNEEVHRGYQRAGFKALAGILQNPDGASMFVGGTTRQLANVIEDSKLADGGLFDVLIIDEAGALDVAQAMLAIRGLAEGGTLIVAGDPKQLPPIHQADPPKNLDHLVGSIYEFYSEWHQIDDEKLLTNYRSNAEIVELSYSAGYDAGLHAARPDRRIAYAADAEMSGLDGVPADWPDALPYSGDLLKVADPNHSVVCVTHTDGISGQWNQFEAETVASLVYWYRRTLAAGVDQGKRKAMTDKYFWTQGIGVVTPHRAQRTRIVELLSNVFKARDNEQLTRLINDAVDTVERFQGQERDVILASYAVGDPDTIAEEAEFLLALNRFNVLATRARAKLIVVLSRELVSHIGTDLQVLIQSEMLKDFVDLFCNEAEQITLRTKTAGDVEADLRWHAS